MGEFPDLDDPSTVAESPPLEYQAEETRDLVPALTILWHRDLGRVGKMARLEAGTTEISRKTPPFDGADITLSRQAFLIVDHRQGAAELRPGDSPIVIKVEGPRFRRNTSPRSSSRTA